MTHDLNSHISLNSHQESDEIPAWLATARAYKQREKSELSEITTSEPGTADRSTLNSQCEKSEKSEISPQEKVAELRRWLAMGVIADTHKLGIPIEIRPGEMIVDGPQFVRRCLARIDAGEPGPNTSRRLETYHARLARMIGEELPVTATRTKPEYVKCPTCGARLSADDECPICVEPDTVPFC